MTQTQDTLPCVDNVSCWEAIVSALHRRPDAQNEVVELLSRLFDNDKGPGQQNLTAILHRIVHDDLEEALHIVKEALARFSVQFSFELLEDTAADVL